jgi:hypothetical protein
VLHRGLPFEVKIPTAETRQALEDAHTRKNLESFSDSDSLYQDLGI